MSRQLDRAVATPPSSEQVHGSADSAPGRAILPLAVRGVTGLAAVVLLVMAARLPIWRAVFHAPQYPDGLNIVAYGNKVNGDLSEITELSHYIGMPPFKFAGMPEMRLWPVVIGLAIVIAILAVVTRRRWLRRLATAALWSVPVGALAIVQFRLWQTGHSLDPTSPIRVEAFTPKVLGPTTLMNFTVVGYPGMALVLIMVAAVLVTAGPFVIRALTPSNTQAPDKEPRLP
jgi:hypothetical protein